MKRLNSGFAQLADDDLANRGQQIVKKVGAQPKLSALAALLPPITDAVAALRAAIILDPGPARVSSIAGARAVLSALLAHLADEIEKIPNLTDADLAGTGFALRQKPGPGGEVDLTAPDNLRLLYTGISGELLLRCGKVPGAKLYEAEITLDPVNGPWVRMPAFPNTRDMVLKGLTRGKDYYVRVRGVGPGREEGPWSDVATEMVK